MLKLLFGAVAVLGGGVLLAAAAPGLGPHPFQIHDMAGRMVTLAGTPHRVVMIPPQLPRYATVDDTADDLVGGSQVADGQVADTVLSKIFPKLARLPAVGRTPMDVDPERILALKPDAIIVWRHDALPPLPGLIEIRSDPLAQEQSVRDMWTLFGRIAGKSDRAAELLRASDQAFASAQAQVKTSRGPSPRVVTLYGGAGLGTIGGKFHYFNGLIEAAGGRNPADGTNLPVALTLEELAALDPDVILLSFSYRRQPGDLYADPDWRILRAVRARRVYRMPAFPDAAGPVDRPLALLWLADVLHPKAMKDDLSRQVAQTYRRTYNYALTPTQLDDLLNKGANAGSAAFGS